MRVLSRDVFSYSEGVWFFDEASLKTSGPNFDFLSRSGHEEKVSHLFSAAIS
jgi:hypothetical protein